MTVHAVIDEVNLMASLDDTWRTPISVKRKFKIPGEARLVAAALDRLARAGHIERRTEETKARRRGIRQDHKPIRIEFFRRRQYGETV